MIDNHPLHLALFALLLALPLAWGCNNAKNPGNEIAASRQAIEDQPQEGNEMPDKVVKMDEEWKQLLSPEEYKVTRQKGTERPFTGKYYKHEEEGTYLCVACGNELFSSETKYESGSGWPSFWQPVDKSHVDTEADTSLGMVRTEVLCSRCGAHLGHVFNDGPDPTGLRYCINSVALDFEPADEK